MDFIEASRLFDRGTDLYDSGKYAEAAQVLRQAASKTESQQTNNVQLSATEKKQRRDFVLEIWDWCAMALYGAKKFGEAVECNNRNLAVRLGSSDYGPGNKATLENRERLVSNYSELKQHENAIVQCREIVKMVDSSINRNMLADQLFRKGGKESIEEAVNINHFTLMRDGKNHGKDYFPLCQARYNLGMELYKLEKYEAAKPYLQENATILKTGSRPDSPERYVRLLQDTETALASCISTIETNIKQKESEKKACEEKDQKEKEEKAREERERKDKEKKARETEERKARERKAREDKERKMQERKAREDREQQEREKKAREEKEQEKKRLQQEQDRLEQERKENFRQEEVRRQEEERRKALIRESKTIQDRRNRRVRTGISLGLSSKGHCHTLTPELEKSGNLAALEALIHALNNEVQDWDRRLKAAKTSALSSLLKPEQPPSRHKRALSDPSRTVVETREGTPKIKRASSQSRNKRSSSPIRVMPNIDYPKAIDKECNNVAEVFSGESKMQMNIKGDIVSNEDNAHESEVQSDVVPLITYSHSSDPQSVRKFRSNENLRSPTSSQLEPEHRVGRSLSVGSKDRKRRSDGQSHGTNLGSNAHTRADTWFENLGDSAHRILDKYNGYLFEGNNNEMKSYEQVKIAILDTGVAQSSKANTPETIRRSKARLKWRQPKGNDMPPREDEDGHGTQVASIILQVTPFAQVFIYRIVRHREDPINPSIVADAIEDAVQAGVDIINLSFGWDHEHDEVRTALKRCIEQDVLVFAATSNNDLESVSGMAYPASDDRVIAIDAASSRGEWLPSNPGRDNEIKTQRFTALGEGIKTDFPPELGSADGSTRMSGTSAATPIAVGIAALVLEFARQPPLGYAKKAAMFLKRPEAMRAVLAGTVAKRFSRHGEYHHLVPAELFTCDKNTVDTGDWYSSKGPRGRAVNKITDVLGRKYGHEFAVPMHDRIEEEFMRLAYAKRASH